MGTSIDCHSCGRPVPGDQAFCGRCGTPVLQAGLPAPTARGSDDGPRSAGPWRVRVPWSLGLLGLLATSSLFFGGGRSSENVALEAYLEADAAAERAAVELPSSGTVEVWETEIEEPGGKDAAAARVAIEQELGRAPDQESGGLASEIVPERTPLDELRAQEDSARRAQIAELERLKQEAEAIWADVERAAGSESQAESASPTESPAPSASTEDGVLRLIVLPFADVYVQGALQARATSRFELTLAPGTYDLRLVNENRATIDTTFVIKPGEPTGVRATLPPRNQ